MKKKKDFIDNSGRTIFLCAIAGGTVYYYLFAPQFPPLQNRVYLCRSGRHGRLHI